MPRAHISSSTWRLQVALPAGEEIKYKYMVRGGGSAVFRWEPGSDRLLRTSKNKHMRVTDHVEALCLGSCRAKTPGIVAHTHASTHHSQKLREGTPGVANGIAEALLKETDEYLHQTQSTPMQFKKAVRKNRLLLQRAHSILDANKAVDSYTRQQVQERMGALERDYHHRETVSHRSTQESLMSRGHSISRALWHQQTAEH